MVRVYVCGRLALECGSTVVRERDFPARQGRLAWCFLVVNRNRPVGRLELAEAIWGDAIPDGWDTTLNGVVSRLRAMLRPLQEAHPAVGIASDAGRYSLHLPDGAVVDRERARSGLHAAETALRASDLNMALSEARVAMEIAARGFLEGEDLPWIEGQRRILRDIRFHAWETTIAADLGRGAIQRAEREAEDLLALDPLNEKAVRLLMRASAAQGNRAGVVRAMHRCRYDLNRLAGMTPSAETEMLYETLTRSA
jgi:SARP family transcriptional regulator, regulator of embCAB operon